MQFCSLDKTYVACGQHLEYVPPGIRVAPGRRRAGRHAWTAWSSAESRSPLKLDTKNMIIYFSKYAPFLKPKMSHCIYLIWIKSGSNQDLASQLLL